MKPPVEIVDYDEGWPALFEAARARILAACGERIVALEHIGSTSVPGLAAKPIIDMMPGVRTLEDAEACVDAMEAAGYTYRPDLEHTLPDRRYFTLPWREHVHMAVVGGHFWRRHLAFRDALRGDPETAGAYAALKRSLAARFRRDREAYTEAKTGFIEDVVARSPE